MDKLWIFTGLLLICSIILDTTTGFHLTHPFQELPNIDNETDNKTIINNITTPHNSESDESVNINDRITKIQPETTTEIVEHNILSNIYNQSLPSSKTISEDLSKKQYDALTTTAIPSSTINFETITESIIENHIEPFESSSLVRNLDEHQVHKLQDQNSNIEIHELATGSETLEDNIRNSVKEEISLDTAFESTALEALEDIPEPDVRKALAEDLLDGLNQKDIRNEPKFEENMARHIYVDEKEDRIEIAENSSARGTSTEHSEISTENINTNILENITELPEIKLEGKSVSNSTQNNVDIKNDEIALEQNLRLAIEKDDIKTTTTPDTNMLDGLTTNVQGYSEITTISNDKDLESRHGRVFDNINMENSSNENSNELGRLRNPYKSANNNVLSHQAQKILNLEKTRSGRTFKNNEFLTNSENMINDDVIIEKRHNENINNNEENLEIEENSNLDEIIDSTTIKNIETNLDFHNLNSDGSHNNKEPKFGKNLEGNSMIDDENKLNSVNDKEEENNLIETTTLQINENEENVIENEFNLTENTILEEQEPIKYEINREVEEIKGKNIDENLQDEKQEVSTEISPLQSSNSGDLIVKPTEQEQLNSREMTSNSELFENKEEGISKNEINLETNNTSPLEQNTNSIEIENPDNYNKDEIMQGKDITETTTAQIDENLSEIIDKNISGDKIIDPIVESIIGAKEYVQKTDNANIESQVITEKPMELTENVQENLTSQENTENQSEISQSQNDLSMEMIITTTQIPINVESTSTEKLKSKQEMIKKLNEEILETENNAIENIELQHIEKIKSNNSQSSESSQSSQSILQTTSSTTDSSSSGESTETISTTENNFDTTTTIPDNKISKNNDIKNTENLSISSSEESSEEKDKKKHKPKIPKVNIYDILSGNIKNKENSNNERKDNNSLSENNLLENFPANGQLLQSETTKNEKQEENLNGMKILIQSDESAKIPSLIFETTTILPLKIFNNTPKSIELSGNKRTFQSDDIINVLENDTTALAETLMEAAELTTELSRHITSFRSIMETDIEIPNETHETYTITHSNNMASSNIGKALPNHGLKSDTFQTNTSIVILICTTTVIMIIGLLAVTFYRYRGKHGTLDIQLEEQRHGKGNNDEDDGDDDDSDITSSLNGSSSATQSLQSNEKDNITIQTNELSLLSKSHDESE